MNLRKKIYLSLMALSLLSGHLIAQEIQHFSHGGPNGGRPLLKTIPDGTINPRMAYATKPFGETCTDTSMFKCMSEMEAEKTCLPRIMYLTKSLKDQFYPNLTEQDLWMNVEAVFQIISAKMKPTMVIDYKITYQRVCQINLRSLKPNVTFRKVSSPALFGLSYDYISDETLAELIIKYFPHGVIGFELEKLELSKQELKQRRAEGKPVDGIRIHGIEVITR